MKLFIDRKGMEMWQLVLIILGILLLLWGLIWLGGLGNTASNLLGRLGRLF